MTNPNLQPFTLLTTDTRTWFSDEPSQEMTDRLRNALETDDTMFNFRSERRFVAVPTETISSIEEIPGKGSISVTYPERIESS
jgi:hypothetical protein